MSQHPGHYPPSGPPGQPGYYNQQQGRNGRNQGAQPSGQPGHDQGYGDGYAQQQQYGGYYDSQSPRTGSQGGGYPPPPPPPVPQPQQYNPQNYAQPAYNPQHYASPQLQQHQLGSQSGYNPPGQAMSSPQAQYANSPSNYSSGGFSPLPTQQSFSHSPQRQSLPQQYSYSSQASGSQYSYSGEYSQQNYQYDYQQYPPPPPPPSSAPQNAPYPTDNNHVPQRSSSFQHHQQRQYSASPAMPSVLEEWRPSPPDSQPDARRPSPLLYQPNDPYAAFPSPPGASPGPTPPAHGPARSASNRHPQSRPLPGPPQAESGSDYFQSANTSRTNTNRHDLDRFSQEDLFEEVESAVMNVGNQGRAMHSPTISISRPPGNAGQNSTAHSSQQQSYRNGSPANGHLSSAMGAFQPSDESDAEGAQGLAMMQMAEEEENRRRQSSISQRGFSSYNSFGSPRSPQHLAPHASDSDDYHTVDMSSFGGGYDVHMPYGDTTHTTGATDVNGYADYSQPVSQHSSMRRSHASQSSQMSRTSAYDYRPDAIHPFPPINNEARVDAGGTGGLAEPGGRRQSFDEGDEYSFMEGPTPDRFPDEPLEIFYQPASTTWRPLPPPPPERNTPQIQTDFHGLPSQSGYPTGPDGYEGMYHQGQWVPRSTSLVSHTTTPQVQQPLRSKTDAEERRLRQIRAGQHSGYETTPASAVPGLPLDLPSLPGKRFMPSQLGAPAFKKCEEPWSLSSLLKWLLIVTSPDQVTEIKEAEVKEALVALFTNKVPTMNITDAEALSNKVVQDMYAAETLVTTEEWVKIVPGDMEGVIYQLTGAGCYSPTLHNHVIPGRCYAHHCQRTLKKLNLLAQPVQIAGNWAEFYNLKKEDVANKDKKELERQHILFEIVQTEDKFMEQLNVLRVVFRDPLSSATPSIITPRRKEKFLNDVFGKVDAIKQANEDHLLPQLKYRQQEQGPFVVGFSDIFRQWIRKAKSAYIDYAGGFPGATFMVRQEIDRNMDFRSFIDRMRVDKRTERLGWDTFLKAPITRLQRYTLLLQTVLKTMKTDSEEKSNLRMAYDEVKFVTLECDARVAEMQRKVDLSDLALKLVLRPGMQNAVELNLDHFGRELIHRGDLQRQGSNRFTWLDCHAILFDHYLVLAKTVAQRVDQGGKMEKYDVSRLPIPMDLLLLESTNDPAVQKSTTVKGLTAVRDVGGRVGTPADPTALTRTSTAASGVSGPPTHTNTGGSNAPMQAVTAIGDSKDADRILYPFRVKHLGRDVYTLFAPSEQARWEWCTKITEAKTKHAMSLHNQNAEPFKLRVMADSAFVFDALASSGRKSVVIEGTPVDRAVKEVEQRFRDVGRPGPVCRARVNCATSFMTLDQSKHMIAVGTDFGVYMSDTENPRGWTKCITMTRVTQVAVLEEFNLFLLIADKSLIAYHLDVICPSEQNDMRQSNDSARRAPQKVSGNKDVNFFVTGKMKDRMLVMYKKRENLASIFKVLEPVYQKSTEKKRNVFKRGTTELFRDFDDFYIPAECVGINLFQSSLAVSTARGFEVLTLDKKQPFSVPDLRADDVKNISEHIKDQKALSMLRLSDQEFILVYANCAVYVNKHGDVSRSVIMEFVGSAQAAALYGAYLILFDNDFVEIRNAQNGRLKQIVAGNDIKCLDDGGSWSSSPPSAAPQPAGTNLPPRTVKFVMQHPEMEKTQLVVELVLNEKKKD